MNILLTNTFLIARTGSECYIRDVAQEWVRRGFHPFLYSSRLGKMADDLRRAGFFVTDDLDTLPVRPDLIHGQHHMETMAAIARFPDVPAVYLCHGWVPWEEMPPLHPQIMHYMGVSDGTLEVMKTVHGIPKDKLTRVLNFVDLNRFPPRPPLPNRPLRALIFSNHAAEDNMVPLIRQVCRERDMDCDVAGARYGSPCDEPEQLLPGYDLVFAKGRAALEAMAVGCATILCDVEGLAGYLTCSNFASYRPLNFGVQTLTQPITQATISLALDAYDPDDSQALRDIVRDQASLSKSADQLEQIYRDAIAKWQVTRIEPAEQASAMSTYLRSLVNPVTRHASNHYYAQIKKCEQLQLECHQRDQALAMVQDKLTRVVNHPAWRIWERISHSWPFKIFNHVAAPPKKSTPANLLAGPPQNHAEPPPFKGSALACVILSLNNPPSLIEAVRSVLTDEPDIELVVVNSGGGQAAESLKGTGLTVRVIEREERLTPGAARNLGWLSTRAPYVAFLASDCIVKPGWVRSRIDAHQAGAVAVSGAMAPPETNSIPEWASHILLFANRLPGVSEAHAGRYSVSYDRRLFSEYGGFREDLRAGEDTEFNARFQPHHPISWVPMIQCTHQHPRTLRALLSDQFARGQRMCKVRIQWHGQLNRVPLFLNAVLRWWPLWKTARRATDGQERHQVWKCLPVLPLGALAYAMGVSTFRLRSPLSKAWPRQRRLYVLITLRNAMEYLPDFMTNIRPHVDGVIALDDGSSDGTADYIKADPLTRQLITRPSRTPHIWDEAYNRRLLIEAAHEHDIDWILVLDADERLEEGFRARADKVFAEAGSKGWLALSIRCLECWDAPDQVRVDGIWGQKYRARLFRPRTDHAFEDRRLHGQWAPKNSQFHGGYPWVDLRFYHISMITAKQRAQRVAKYRHSDPHNLLQTMGYEYLLDYEGLRTQTLEPGRRYKPL